MKHFLASVLLVAAFSAPAIYGQRQTVFVQSTAKVVSTKFYIRTQLFFGRSRTNGKEVSTEEFDDFLIQVITPEFPDGLTVLDGIGQFREADANIMIREKAKILILFYPARTRRQSSRKIERIRAAYKKRFAQQSVLRVDDSSLVRVSF
jgi:hypothetical protein